MANHLEDLAAEWLEFKGYFVRKSVLVGRLAHGGFEGELDVIGFNPISNHVLHIECSLDADPWPKRESRFTAKFDRGRRYIKHVVPHLADDAEVDQVALLQLGGGDRTELGGARLMWVSDFIRDIMDELALTKPDRQAIPSTYPNLRTLQLAAQSRRQRKSHHRLVPT